MKKQHLILIIILFTIQILNAQWVSKFDALGEGDYAPIFSKGVSIVVDNSNCCYITGYCSGGTLNNDLFVAKYNPSGNLMWSRKYDGGMQGDDKGYAIALDANGGIYVVGTTTVLDKSYEVIVQKYDKNGNLQWQDVFGETTGLKDDKGLDIAVSLSGNVFVTGYTTGTDNKTNIFIRRYNPTNSIGWFKVLNNPEQLDAKGYGIVVDEVDNVYITGYTNTTANSNDLLIAKYSIKGNVLWMTTYDCAQGDDQTCCIDIDQEHNIYVAGYVTRVNDNIDCALLRFNTNGEFAWIKTDNGNGNLDDKGYGIVVDEADNAVIFTGYSTYNHRAADYLTASYNFDGSKKWSKTYDGPVSGCDISHAIALKSNGNVIVTGESQGNYYDNDYATLEYNKTGELVQIARYSMSYNSDDKAMDVAVSINGDVYVTGTSAILMHLSEPHPYTLTLKLNWGEPDIKNPVPDKFELSQNFPNPFNPVTNISFTLGEDTYTNIKVYNSLGQLVEILVDGVLNAGTHKITFNGAKLSSGIYFYDMTSGNYRDIKKMMLIK